MSKIIAMLTDDKELMGFVMLAGEGDAFSGASWEGDCILTGVPKNPEVLSDPLCEFFQSNKNEEFPVTVASSAGGFVVSISGLLSAELNQNLAGVWGPIDGDLRGHCLVPNRSS